MLYLICNSLPLLILDLIDTFYEDAKKHFDLFDVPPFPLKFN